MKKEFIILALLLMAIFPSSAQEVPNKGDWNQQLEKIRQNEVLNAKGYPLLVEWTYQNEIKAMDGVKEIKKRLLSETENYLPFFGKDSTTMKLLTLKDIKRLENKKTFKALIKSLSDYLNLVIEPGMHIVKLTWEFHSKSYESLCVVSDNGIVYDHIIMNLMITESTENQRIS